MELRLVYYGNTSARWGLTISASKFDGGPGLIEMIPPSNGPKVVPIRLLVHSRFGLEMPGRATLGKTLKGHNILLPERVGDEAGVIALVKVNQLAHRNGARPSVSTAEVVESSCGYGAWGYGYVAIVKLLPGQYHSSTHAGFERYVCWLYADCKFSHARLSGEEFGALQETLGERPLWNYSGGWNE